MKSNNTAVVYVTNGKDRIRLGYSMQSLKKYSSMDFDVFLMSDVPEKCTNEWPISCRIVDTSKIMSDVGFFPEGWNRWWPYTVLSRIVIPLVPELQKYSKVISLDTDTLVLHEGFDFLCSYPCRDYEVVGTGHDPYSVNTPDHSTVNDYVPLEFQEEMKKRTWKNNPIESHIHFNPGMSIWNIPKIIENGIDWYKERLKVFWTGITKGKYKVLDEDFINTFMDSAAIISSKYHTKPKQPTPSDFMLFHYISCANGESSVMSKEARNQGFTTI